MKYISEKIFDISGYHASEFMGKIPKYLLRQLFTPMIRNFAGRVFLKPQGRKKALRV
jgi:hypothetical protein